MHVRPVFTCLIALLACSPAWAQPAPAKAAPANVAPVGPSPVAGAPPVAESLNMAPPPPTLAALVQQPAWQGALVATARNQFNQVPGSCAAASFKPTGELTVYQQPSFGAGQTPVAGMWAEKVAVTGCGPARTLNILTIGKPSGDPERVAMMPGTSHADPVTQRSALQYAQAIAARASPAGCTHQSFIGAEFAGYVGLPNADVRDGRDGRAWQEDWLLYACGTVYGIKMQFTPNGDGTQLVGSNPIRLGGPAQPTDAPAAAPAAAPKHR